MSKLESLTSKELLDLFNKVSGESVKRFADRKAGLARVQKLIAKDKAAAAKVTALLGLASTSVTVVDAPLPTIEEALREGLDATAKARGVKPLKKQPQPKKVVGGVTPIEGSAILVAVAGKVVRKENAEKVQAGAVLWGKVKAPPAEKDKLEGAGSALNLNYPAKASVKPMREGTKRAKLVGLMRTKGVTVEEVMKLLGLDRGQAVYKLRDLHYMSGHGLEVRDGRVFVTDKA